MEDREKSPSEPAGERSADPGETAGPAGDAPSASPEPAEWTFRAVGVYEAGVLTGCEIEIKVGDYPIAVTMSVEEARKAAAVILTAVGSALYAPERQKRHNAMMKAAPLPDH